jgi:hypothetical protein
VVEEELPDRIQFASRRFDIFVSFRSRQESQSCR